MTKKINCKYLKYIKKHGYYRCTRLNYMDNGHWGKCRLLGNFRGCVFYEEKDPWYIRLIEKLLTI